METRYIVAISVICGVLCLLTLISVIFNSVRSKLEKHIQQKFNKDLIVGATSKANFFGIKSKGAKQIKGNGAIVLTKEQIYFVRALPFKEYIIPINTVKNVSMPKSFNGRSVFRNLLCVHYYADGQEESIAWVVENPDRWKVTIEKILKNS